MPEPLVQQDCGVHVDWDCYYGTFVPVLGLPLLYTDRCQQQLNAYDACMYAKDAGYRADGSGAPVPKKPGDEFPWGYVILGVGALVTVALVLKR